MSDWRIFRADVEPHNDLALLPGAPPWRPFGKNATLIAPPASPEKDENLDYALARTFRTTPEMVEAVNTALYLRRPLLVTGKPGNGKSSLIRAVARQLRLGPVLRWSITSKSTLKEGLYLYDALGRLDAQRRRKSEDGDSDDSDIGDFIELGPLGTAMLPSDWPRALLIDEIDKSDLDLPNDLLNIFEEGEYSIPELARAKVSHPEGKVKVRTWRRLEEKEIPKGYVRCTHFPFVLMTSNREREFPPAFLRRCIRIAIEEPGETMLGDIVASHFDENTRKEAADLISQFMKNRASKELATDQLLNAVYLVLKSGQSFSDPDKTKLIEKLYKPISGPEATR
jgi:MoxR-like ATPase